MNVCLTIATAALAIVASASASDVQCPISWVKYMTSVGLSPPVKDARIECRTKSRYDVLYPEEFRPKNLKAMCAVEACSTFMKELLAVDVPGCDIYIPDSHDSFSLREVATTYESDCKNLNTTDDGSSTDDDSVVYPYPGACSTADQNLIDEMKREPRVATLAYECGLESGLDISIYRGILSSTETQIMCPAPSCWALWEEIRAADFPDCPYQSVPKGATSYHSMGNYFGKYCELYGILPATDAPAPTPAPTPDPTPAPTSYDVDRYCGEFTCQSVCDGLWQCGWSFGLNKCVPREDVTADVTPAPTPATTVAVTPAPTPAPTTKSTPAPSISENGQFCLEFKTKRRCRLHFVRCRWESEECVSRLG